MKDNQQERVLKPCKAAPSQSETVLGQRRTSLKRIAIAGASLAALQSHLCSSAWAQNTASWTSKPIRLLVGYPPGGPVDLAARSFGATLEKVIGQSVVIENKGGASGMLAAQTIAQAPSDGSYLFFAASPTISIAPHLQKGNNFDPLTQLAPIAQVVEYANVLMVNKDLPFKTVSDLVAYAKANPDKLSFGSAGVGGSNHLSAELLKKMTQTQMVHVPYRGNAPAMLDVMGGKIAFMFDIVITAKGYHESGKARALAVTSKTRNRALPDIPTMVEAGVPGFDVTGWFALYGPTSLNRDLIGKINQATKLSLSQPALVGRMTELGFEVKHSSAEELSSLAKSEHGMWADVIRGLKID
jgi:tripartite-type tricarboxylate transporter receptor subunit TctC